MADNKERKSKLRDPTDTQKIGKKRNKINMKLTAKPDGADEAMEPWKKYPGVNRLNRSTEIRKHKHSVKFQYKMTRRIENGARET